MSNKIHDAALAVTECCYGAPNIGPVETVAAILRERLGRDVEAMEAMRGGVVCEVRAEFSKGGLMFVAIADGAHTAEASDPAEAILAAAEAAKGVSFQVSAQPDKHDHEKGISPWPWF